MKPLHWDSQEIDPWTGQRYTWDSPNPNVTWDGVLEPGDPGYTPPPLPPAPKPKKKKPFRRAPKTELQPEPTHPNIMSHTFKFNIAPLAGGGFTARAVRGAQADEASMTAAIAAAAGVEAEKVPLVIQAFFQQVLNRAAVSEWSPEQYGCVSFRPTAGGNEAAPTDFHNADDINAGVSIAIAAEKIRVWRGTLAMESMGEVGLITPVIESILDITTGQQDKYTAANMIQLRGDDLRFKLNDVTQGVFFRSGSAAEVRATLYGQNEPGIVSCAVPAALSGPLQVRIAAYINGSVRSYTYTHLITAV